MEFILSKEQSFVRRMVRAFEDEVEPLKDPRLPEELDRRLAPWMSKVILPKAPKFDGKGNPYEPLPKIRMIEIKEMEHLREAWELAGRPDIEPYISAFLRGIKA